MRKEFRYIYLIRLVEIDIYIKCIDFLKYLKSKVEKVVVVLVKFNNLLIFLVFF